MPEYPHDIQASSSSCNVLGVSLFVAVARSLFGFVSQKGLSSMPHTYAYGQAIPTQQSQPMSLYGQPFFLQSAPVAAPPSPAAPPPIPTSPTVCLRIAETIAPTLTHPQLGLLHYVAFMLLTTDGAPYQADSPQAVPVLSFLVQKQLLVPSGGGYTLTNIGHAVLAHIEAAAIR